MAADDDKLEGGFTRRLVGRIPDVMGKALVAGTGALFLTEEGIRHLVSDLKLPGDVVRTLVQQAETTKRELFRFVGQEVRSFLQQANLSEELTKVLSGVTLDIHTTVRFVPNDKGGVKPVVSNEIVGAPAAEGAAEAASPPREAALPSPPVPVATPAPPAKPAVGGARPPVAPPSSPPASPSRPEAPGPGVVSAEEPDPPGDPG
ncbi:MAG: hypothetical protein RBU45_04885 [Myxococcota bacterium]|jgi:hypothetical protein|nr:hypothetical protein [Myxococcota bacterium]